MPNISVLIADQHSVLRAGVRALLSRDKSLRVVGEAENGVEAVKQAKKLKPKVMVMDVDMPLMDGIEACRQIIEAMPSTRVLFLSGQWDRYHIETSVTVGACGYLKKTDSANTLASAVRRVAGGDRVYAKEIEEHIQAHMKLPDYAKTFPCGLTSSQYRVAQLVGENRNGQEISDIMQIGLSRVKKIVESSAEKVWPVGKPREKFSKNELRDVLKDWWRGSKHGWS